MQRGGVKSASFYLRIEEKEPGEPIPALQNCSCSIPLISSRLKNV